MPSALSGWGYHFARDLTPAEHDRHHQNVAETHSCHSPNIDGTKPVPGVNIEEMIAAPGTNPETQYHRQTLLSRINNVTNGAVPWRTVYAEYLSCVGGSAGSRRPIAAVTVTGLVWCRNGLKIGPIRLEKLRSEPGVFTPLVIAAGRQLMRRRHPHAFRRYPPSRSPVPPKRHWCPGPGPAAGWTRRRRHGPS